MRIKYQYGYLKHKCIMLDEEDVLDFDISGTGIFPQLKRRWHDLFLLSYRHPKARGFYNSSLNMVLERYRQYRTFRKRIHPMSRFLYYWDYIMLYSFIITKLFYRLSSSMVYTDIPLACYYMICFLECFLIFDLFVRMKSGYIDTETREVVLESTRCNMEFCHKKLFIYVASSTPLHMLMFLRYKHNITLGLYKCNYFNCALRVLSTFSLYRVFQLFSENSTSSVGAYNFFKICVLAVLTLNQVEMLCDVAWVCSAISHGVMEKDSYQTLLIQIKYILNYNDINIFTLDFARLVKSLFSFSFGPVSGVAYWDMMKSLLVYVTANLFYMWMFLETFRYILTMTYAEEQLVKSRDSVMNTVRTRQLFDELGDKVEHYFEGQLPKLKIVEKYNYLYKSLPRSLKKDIAVECYMKFLMKIRHFHDWPRDILEELVFMFVIETYLPKDCVADSGVSGVGLKIVYRGMLAVYNSEEVEIGHMIDGDYFGMISLVTDHEKMMSRVIAVTSTTVLILRKLTFRNFMTKYPRLFLALKNELKQEFEVGDPFASMGDFFI